MNRRQTIEDLPWESKQESMRMHGFSAGEIDAARKKYERKQKNADNKRLGIKKPPKERKEHQEMQDLKKQCDGSWGKELGIQNEIYLIPNSAPKGMQAAAYFRSEGLRPGYPDLGLDVPRGRFHGLRIEMKRADGTGRTSPDQERWVERLTRRGYKVVVPAGVHEAMTAIESYMALGEFRWAP